MKMNYLLPSIALAALVLNPAFEPSVRATVTNVVWYRFGESDPGAANGAVATNSIDVVSNRVLKFIGGPFYDTDVAPFAVGHVGSALGLRFWGAAWGTNALIPGLVDNFGLELWVKPSALAGDHVLAYNGHSGNAGWGLNLANGVYSVLFGGQAVIGAVPAATNVWMHLALVRDGGTTTLYTNGIAATNSTIAPNVPAGVFSVATTPSSPGLAVFQGILDEVRVFTFAPCQFSTSDLLLNQPTAFRASAQEDLLPTFKRLQEKNPSAVMMWFQNGKLWNSRVDAQEAMRERGERGRMGDKRQSGFRDRKSSFGDRPRRDHPSRQAARAASAGGGGAAVPRRSVGLRDGGGDRLIARQRPDAYKPGTSKAP